MPRKGPAPKRPLVIDPVYGSPVVTQLINKVLLDGKKSVAEHIVYGALEGVREKTRATRSSCSSARWTMSHRRSRCVPPRRWCDLPGPRRGAPRAPDDARAPLAHRLLARSSREDDDRAPHERDPRRVQRPRCRGEASRGHAQDGRVQQGLRALPLVIPAPTGAAPPVRSSGRAGGASPEQPTRGNSRGTGCADGPHEGPQHRHHGSHRCRQDDDHRADPVLHRGQLQDR